ncbi:hypothetical protein OZX69_00610 [Lactobacillus sp. ESL0731]|uniref:hypothetical protein n=1 Tax=unclassified Lactobacillus TaxID=2620435 RepID=UPI0023F8F311|nr:MULTISPECIES: hypothetical protein [unclassified Lactobacillus]WEV51260.1 hypothetical protein OZX63_00610 [Lactobacillus sp. ESL0700]WEV62390.1 hypothetical protein OZX69_00610 [Lactobacillus sp. ESL0731]
MKKTISNYQITMTFALIALVTSLNPIFLTSNKTKLVGSFFFIFVMLISFLHEYLANHTTVRFSQNKLKAIVALANTIIGAAVYLLICFYII